MIDKSPGIINIPDKEEGVKDLTPKQVIEKHYQNYFRDFSKEKLLLAIQRIKKSGVNFKKDKDFIAQIIEETRNMPSQKVVI